MASVRGIPLSKVSPAFLHANSTSHTWVFSAFAELIDNAYDPDVSASELLIDKVDIRGVPCLIFLDNGAGMDSDRLLKMLSFGFCEKDVYEKQGSHQPIGHYGNGFKSGSMRIGQDALVFTRCHNSASIGFLSQTYLKSINVDSVMVPILEYRLPSLERIKSQESRNNLNAILEYSVFKMEKELKEELKALEGSKTGTKIIIYNLKRLQDGTYELDFSSDSSDIRCPEAHEADMTSVYHRPIQHNVSEYKRSLREYCSILYLRPRMKVTIRGTRVRSKLISRSLSNTEIDTYKPTWLVRPVKIIFGFNCDTHLSDDCDYGMMLYHRNRLIKAFEKVGYQKQPNGLGVGVVGVVQVDFLQPVHNKQDFNKDEKFNSVMSAFANKLNDYWNEKKGTDGSPQPVSRNHPDWLWAQCDHCLKWRRLPDVVDSNSLPENWFCRMNPDGTHNRCDIPEEPEDEDLATKRTYAKTFKKKQEERKRVQQLEKEKEEDIKRRKIMAKEQELKQKEATLRAIQQVAAAQPETRTVMSLQKALAEARRREEQQKRLILQFQEQKKIMEEERNSLLQMAESLQTSNGGNNNDILKQMSQLISSCQQNSMPSTLISPSKRKSNTQTSPTQNTQIKKSTGIKVEPENFTSAADEDDNMGNNDENLNERDISFLASPANQNSESMNDNEINENIPALNDDADEASSFATPPRQHSTSFSENNNSDILSAENGDNQNQTDLLPSKPDSSASQAPKKCRKNKQKGRVVAVIDLTCDSEFGELIDIKPSPEELRATLQDSLQYEMIDVKPDKVALDLYLANKGQDKEQETVSVPKEEIAESTIQDMTQTLSKKDSAIAVNYETDSDFKMNNESEIQFGNYPAASSFVNEFPESFKNNLEAAMVVIQERIQQGRPHEEGENHNSDSALHETVIKDENDEETSKDKSDKIVRKLKDGTNSYSSITSKETRFTTNENAAKTIDERRNNDFENIEDDDTNATQATKHLQQMDDFGEAGYISDDSVDDRSDYRDEKGETTERHIGRKNCSVISQSNSFDNGDYGLKNFSAIEGESSVSQESAAERFQKCSTHLRLSENGTVPANEKLNSPSFPEGSFEGVQQNTKGSSQSFVQNTQKNSNMVYSGETAAESSSVYVNMSNNYQPNSLKFMGRDSVDDEFPDEDVDSGNIQINGIKEPQSSRLSPLKNSGDVNGTISSMRKRPNREQVSSNPIDFSITGDNENTCNEDETFTEFNDDVITQDLINSNSSKNYSHSFDESSLSSNYIPKHVPVKNKSSFNNHKVRRHKLKRTSDQYMQTDIDMAAVKNIFEDNLGVSVLNRKDAKEESWLLHGKMDKSFQTAEFTDSVETEVQTDDFSQDELERLKELQNKLSLKTQLLQNMQQRLTETCINIHKLLGFIVPEAELGDVSNIEEVVRDMVRVSESSF